MSVNVRTKELANGRLSLYLDFYPPIKGANGKFTRREFLKRYNFKRPVNDVEKLLNRENILYADTIRLQREKEILNEQDGIFNSTKKKKDFIEYFETLCEKKKESHGNYGNWLSTLQHLKAYTGGKCQMGDLTEEFCNNFKDYLLNANKLKTVKGKRLSQNSAASYFNKFRCAIKEAFYARLLIENPSLRANRIRQKENKKDFLTKEELQRLAKTDCDLPALKTAALFSAFTGLRWSDIKSLTWGEIQKTDNIYFLHITQKKTKDVIMHPIKEKAVKMLGERGNPVEKVFEGLKYSDSNNDKLKRWVLAAGIHKKITLHNFRHTYATLLLNNGVDFFTVSKMVGHINPSSTLGYLKALTETKVNASNQIDIDL